MVRIVRSSACPCARSQPMPCSGSAIPSEPSRALANDLVVVVADEDSSCDVVRLERPQDLAQVESLLNAARERPVPSALSVVRPEQRAPPADDGDHQNLGVGVHLASWIWFLSQHRDTLTSQADESLHSEESARGRSLIRSHRVGICALIQVVGPPGFDPATPVPK